MFKTTVSWQVARHELLPALRPVSRPNGIGAAHEAKSPLITRPFVPFLHQLLVLDRPRERHYLKAEHLARWEVSSEAAWLAAEGHLDPVAGLRREGPLWRLDAGDGYDASRLALPGWLRAISERLGGRALAAIPHARALWVGTEAMVAPLLEAAQEEAGEPLSPCLFTHDAIGKIELWTPTPDSAHYRSVRGVQLRWGAQETLAWADEYGHPVANLWMEKTAGSIHLICEWDGNPEVLIPQAAFARIPGKSGEKRVVSWTELLPHLRPLDGAAVPLYHATKIKL